MASPDFLKAKTLAVHERLLEIYGYPDWRSTLDPVSEVVSTILSQNTSDVNRDRAYDRLQARFPTWEMVRDAPALAIEEAIRPAGLARLKAPRIKEALHFITRQRGELNLDFLKEMPVEEAKAWLTQINGIGPKTAAIVLLFSLDMPAFPVDTHVHRVTGRLGWLPPRATAAAAYAWLGPRVPPALRRDLHLLLVRHGRALCRARAPRCAECPLRPRCPSART